MNTFVVCSFAVAAIMVLTLATESPCFSQDAGNTPPWVSRIRKDHPRLFFNSETWPAVKARALNEERAWYDKLKRRVDRYPQSPEVKDYGTEAAATAFVFRATEESKYFELAKKSLLKSVEFYNACYAARRSVNWYSSSRINAWSAYDWIYNDLSDEERREIAVPFLHHVDDVQPGAGKPRIPRLNGSGHTTGFYGTPSLLWYAGLATHNDGIDDDRALDFMTKGHDLYMRLLAHRKGAAGDDGGSASATLGYAMGAYPWAEFNFFHTLESATGEDISGNWPHVAYFPNYVIWNWLPGDRELGTGDANHRDNKLPLWQMYTHTAQTMHFYGESQPECASMARWMQGIIPNGGYTFTWPCHPFLLTRLHNAPSPKGPSETLPPARHFENMGQVFMRSGSGPDDTYALFTAGGTLSQHKHFDNNNFTIFKKGFLALDTGTRPEPGLHLPYYYCRTVAHNCILIHKPDEKLPRYWGSRAPDEEDAPVPNDGGQKSQLGSKAAAFETGPHYTYVAGDATGSYSSEKCALALRQFVFAPPDHFVVFDRVTSTKPEYPKTWLLHTAREPRVEGATFQSDHEQGRIFCRTLLPENAKLTKIGGPGKQFWSDGRNWPLPKGYRTPDTNELLGQWRIEISPSQPSTDDLFLHVIQVGDRSSLTTMAPTELLREDNVVGVRFRFGATQAEVLFATQGEAAGRIRIASGGKTLLDRALTQSVAPQVGLLGAPQ